MLVQWHQGQTIAIHKANSSSSLLKYNTFMKWSVHLQTTTQTFKNLSYLKSHPNKPGSPETINKICFIIKIPFNQSGESSCLIFFFIFFIWTSLLTQKAHFIFSLFFFSKPIKPINLLLSFNLQNHLFRHPSLILYLFNFCSLDV